ncbi:MAG: O-antigen ligase family protein [Acidobacteriota bacterium]
MSAVARTDLDAEAPPARRPGTAARLLLFLLAAGGSAAVLAVGFPRGAPDRLPVLLLALALALFAVARPARALRGFCFLFPLAGLLARAVGATDAAAWPVLLFGGLALGWTFRFLYDFESARDPSGADPSLRALVAIWVLATVVAIARAKTWWAIARGLTGRAVNSAGLPEASAIAGSVLTLTILAAGAAFFFLLRRSGPTARARASRAAVAGAAISAFVAVLQAVRIFPEETRPFWKVTGRLSGGATDPNALGLLCGLAIPVLVALALGAGQPRWALPGLILLAAGVVLSGSRSGFLVAVAGGFGAILFSPVRRRARSAIVLAAAVGIILALGMLARHSPGDVGERLGNLFRSSLSLENRASSRPVLWRAAGALFRESPAEGGGLGSFSWRLPDLAGIEGSRLALRDNPGSAYLQALSETGVLGLLVMLAFFFALGQGAFSRLREAPGASAAVLAFLVALVVGSHWLAPEAGFLFFLLAAEVAAPRPGEAAGVGASRALIATVAIFAALALRAVFATADPAEAFRYRDRIGFYAPEAGEGGAFQWTRRRFALRVRRDAPGRISLANYSPEGKPVEITAAADDGPVLFGRTLSSGSSVRLALWAGGRPRVFRFALSRSFVPKRLGLSDRRELGVVVVTPP